MGYEYDAYLQTHIDNVNKGLEWLIENLPNDFDAYYPTSFSDHDRSKYDEEEYSAYDAYFYGRNKSYEVVKNFKKAWLHHIHCNPHHWQHWVLFNDDEGIEALQMPRRYIVEMICDWWAFSWKDENLKEIFTWYDAHKNNMVLHINTRNDVENILNLIREKLNKEVD